ncbi:MAG: hypothetical protein ACPGJU_00615 [Coraliomargarita sp.]
MTARILLFSVLLLASCKTTKVSTLTPINTGADSNWGELAQAEVLVAMQMESPSIRRLFEDEMVKTFRAQNINAVASHTVIPSIAALTKPNINSFLNSRPNRAVMFCTVSTASKRESSDAPKEKSIFDGLTDSGQWDVTFVAIMENALYVHGRPNAIWWNRVKVIADEKKLYPAAEEYVGNEIQTLINSGMLERLK